MVFVFPDDDTFRFALTGGLVPPAVSLAPVLAGRDADGRLWVQPFGPLPKSLPIALRRVGVSTTEAEATDGREVAHWLQAVPLRRDPVPPILTAQTPVLFELSDSTGLPALVGEMLRLGNDRQGIRILGTDSSSAAALLRVIGPPYYTLLRALDHLGPALPRAYLERAPRVWVEVGFTHPLVDLLRAPDGQMVLLRAPQEWAYLDDTPFRDIYEVLEFELPREPAAWVDAPPADKLVVPLRLAPGGGTEPPELWVLTGAGVEQIDSLVRDADDRLIARLAFAIGDIDGQRAAVLRARPGKGGPPALVLDALACRPYLRLPNLFLPVGSRLRPPLRRDAVRQLLADDPDRVTWLVPQEDDSFTPQSLPDESFRPLTDWVDYLLDRDAEALTAWVQAAHFDFAPFVSTEEFVPAPPAGSPRERRPRAPKSAPDASREPPPPSAALPAKAKSKMAPVVPADAFTAQPQATPSELQVQLKEVEARFLAAEGPLDGPQRQALWPKLARLNTDLRHTADAALCWANALWEPSDPPAAWTWGWIENERALPGPELTAADLERLLGHVKPTPPDLRPLVAVLVWAARQQPVPAALRERLPAVRQFLERHDHLLPVRMVWLAWHGLAHLTGADVLTLARVRDRLLERLLAEGLGAERDLPGFLRFAGQRAGDRLRLVRERLERLRQVVHAWSGFEPSAGLQQTPAYIDLLFAFGLARLGEASAARALVSQAADTLEGAGSEAHVFLLQAFQYRIEQVLAGRPHAGPLPPEQLEYLAHMRREEKSVPVTDLVRRQGSYVVERMSEQSLVLSPQEKLDPYRHIKVEQDDVIKELVRLTDVRDRRQITDGVRRLMEQSARGHRLAELRLRVLGDALELASRVGEEFTREVLAQVGPAIDTAGPPADPILVAKEALLLERALFYAAHYDLTDLVQSFASRLDSLLNSPTGRGVFEPLGTLVGQTLRSLRKLGLKDQTERLLQRIADVALGGQTLEQACSRSGRDRPETLRLLLQLATGWLCFDRPEQARPVLDAARAWLLSSDKKDAAERPAQLYTAVACTYIAAAGQAPLDEALGRIEELFTSGRMDRLPNSFTTGGFYSRFHLNIVEAVVLALANEDFALGPAARRWLDDDEFLVRRRIHRDVRAAMAGAGM